MRRYDLPFCLQYYYRSDALDLASACSVGLPLQLLFDHSAYLVYLIVLSIIRCMLRCVLLLGTPKLPTKRYVRPIRGIEKADD